MAIQGMHSNINDSAKTWTLAEFDGSVRDAVTGPRMREYQLRTPKSKTGKPSLRESFD
jgi:hypothetical protein